MHAVTPEWFAGISGFVFVLAVLLSIRIGRLPTRSFAMAFPLIMVGLTAPLYCLVAINYYMK